MTKEDKQIIKRAVKGNWRIGDRTRLKRLLEKNLKLYRENVELEKACEETQELLNKQIEATYKLDKKNAELEQQIEKMKCCFNCKHSRTEYEHCKTDKHEKWEIKEND